MRTFDSSLQSGIILDKWKIAGEKKINLQIINQYPYSHASQSFTKEQRTKNRTVI